jgi:hypothetical protein
VKLVVLADQRAIEIGGDRLDVARKVGWESEGISHRIN